jgi:hypothetical protein
MLLAGLAAAVILLVGWQPWRGRAEPPRSTWSDALAFGAAYFVPRLLVVQSAPSRLDGWLALFVAVASAVGALQGWLVLPYMLRWGGRFVLSLFLLVTVLSPLADRWERLPLLAWYVGLLFGMPMLWSTLEALARRSGGASLPVSFALVSAAAAFALDRAGAARLALASQTLTAALLAWALVAGLRRRMSLARGALPVMVVLAIVTPLLGRLYGGLSNETLALLALGLIAPWTAELPWMRRRPGWERAFVRLGAAALAAGAVVAAAT